jgi:two-component system sensor histidine kinase GlrK
MKIAMFNRLMIGYFTIFILVMSVGIYAIFELYQLNIETHRILNTDNRILEYTEKLADSVLSQLRYEKKYLITKDVVLYNQFLAAKNDFDGLLSNVSSVADTTEKKDSLSRVKSYYDRFQLLTDKEIENVRSRQTTPKISYEQEVGKTADGILEELKNLEDYSRHDIRQRMILLGESAASALKLAIVMAVTSILLVIGISYYITRSITKPLGLLLDRTKEISRGIFDCDLNIPSPPEIMELTGGFNTMCAELKRVDRMKSDFFSSMSHELRTPLTSIKEGISLLQDGVGGAITDKQKRLLGILSEESKRLINLANSFLDLSKMEAGMMTYHFDQGNIVPLIERATTEMVPLMEAKKIALVTRIDDKLPEIKMDRERMLQVLRNVVGNALKFTPKGGQVKISAQHIDGEVKVSVIDTGPGIPKEDLTRIFDKFHQVPLRHPDQAKGTGWGLAIVKHVIHAHGGRVWAESGPGMGSSFIFVLPA